MGSRRIVEDASDGAIGIPFTEMEDCLHKEYIPTRNAKEEFTWG